MSERALPSPPFDIESQPFYEAAAKGKFLIRRCTACGKPHWFPRASCPFCLGETAWEEASGRGVIYSYSVMRRVTPAYAIAYVKLAEGPTMLSNLVECDFDSLAIGQAVEVVFKPSLDGPPIACFKPR